MKNYYAMTLFLNDVCVGQVCFEDKKSFDDFMNAYANLPTDQKWGYATACFEDDGT